MSKKLINKSLREAGVNAFDVSAVNMLADFMDSQGGEQALVEFVRSWREGESINTCLDMGVISRHAYQTGPTASA